MCVSCSVEWLCAGLCVYRQLWCRMEALQRHNQTLLHWRSKGLARPLPITQHDVDTVALPKQGLVPSRSVVASDRTYTVKHCILCVCAVTCGTMMMCCSPMKRADIPTVALIYLSLLVLMQTCEAFCAESVLELHVYICGVPLTLTAAPQSWAALVGPICPRECVFHPVCSVIAVRGS